MVEYYKTQKGYCYKKTQKGGSKRISNKDYEKKTKLKSGGSGTLPASPPPQNINTTTNKSPLTTTPAQQDKVNYFIVNNIKFDLETDDKIITKEINKYITETKYEITVIDNKISIKKIGQGGGKQNKRKKKNQKGGVDLNLLLKKLKCFGNTDVSQNDNQKNEQQSNEQQSAIQDIFNVYNHMDKQIRELQNNAKLSSNAFEKLSKDIMVIPDFNPSDMIKLIESEYIKHNCNTNQQPQKTQSRQNKNATSNLMNNNSDVIKLVIVFCVLIVNKLNVNFRFFPRPHVNKIINEITVFGYVVYLLALLFLKILKK